MTAVFGSHRQERIPCTHVLKRRMFVEERRIRRSRKRSEFILWWRWRGCPVVHLAHALASADGANECSLLSLFSGSNDKPDDKRHRKRKNRRNRNKKKKRHRYNQHNRRNREANEFPPT